MTLELKDICGYLPYGVKVYLDGKSYTVTKWQNGSNNNMLAQQDNGTSSLIFNSGRGDAKFILRPMSDLTKEITHRGEKFVPLYKLTPAFKYFQWSDDRFRLEITQDCVVIGVHSKSSGDWGVHARIDLTTSKLDKLDAWMFDYRGLIPAGLAIDVNTLPENPYER